MLDDLEQSFLRGAGYEQTTDMGLIYQAQGHQPQGWVVLAELYMPMVYRWSRRKGLQPADSSDVVQQVFAKLWNNIERFSKVRPGDSFRAWLRTITKNEIANGRNNIIATPQLTGSIDEDRASLRDPSVGDDEFSSDALRALDTASSRVTPQTWDIFVRTVLYGEPPCEVADELGVDANAVRQARYRVVRILQKELQPLEDSD